jgi:hypothetical protein
VEKTVTMIALTAVLALATVVLAVATAALAKSTREYTRLLRRPNVTGYFEASGNWINLVIQNTGTDLATDLSFSIDLTPDELADIFGPNKHGKRYIAFESLDFLQHIKQLAPSQAVRHRWLHRWIALKENKPRPCTLKATYADRWKLNHASVVPFDLAVFGTWDGTHVMEPPPLESIAESLRVLAKKGPGETG